MPVRVTVASNELAARYAPGDQLIPAGTIRMSSLSGHVITPAVPHVPDGTWEGDPEIVSGPTRYGMDRGDALYVFELRGVPPGTHGQTPNTTVLCTDDWRFTMPTYNRGTDTADFIDDTHSSIVERRGTPWYAVVAVRTPSAGEASNLPAGTGAIVLPDDRVFQLPAIPTSWRSEVRSIRGSDGSAYAVTAEPYNPSIPTASGGQGFIVDNAPGPNGTRPLAAGPETETSSSTIFVGGYAQDLVANPNLFGGLGHHYTGTGPIQIGVERVMARRSQLTVAFAGGGSSAVVSNSKHYVYEPDDPIEPGGPPPPPGGGCSTCDPPDPTIALIAYMFVPGDIGLLHDELEQSIGK